MAIDFGKCLVIRDSVIPVQVVKWNLLIDTRSVDGTGLSKVTWRK